MSKIIALDQKDPFRADKTQLLLDKLYVLMISIVNIAWVHSLASCQSSTLD